MDCNHVCTTINTVLKGKDCGTVLVVNTKDLWHFIRCTHCDSMNVVNMDDEKYECKGE